jgi:hypothetical protein
MSLKPYSLIDQPLRARNLTLLRAGQDVSGSEHVGLWRLADIDVDAEHDRSWGVKATSVMCALKQTSSSGMTRELTLVCR